MATARDHRSRLEPRDLGIGQLFWRIREAVIVGEVDTGSIVLWSPGAERLFGYTADEIVDRPLETIVPERLRTAHRRGIAHYRSTDQGTIVDAPNPIETVGLRKDGSEVPIELSLSRLGEVAVPGRFVLALVRDASERRRAEMEQAERIRADAAREVLERSRRRFSFLAEASGILASSLDYATTLRTVARLAVPTIADYCVVDLIEEVGEVRRVAAVHAEHEKDELVRSLLRYPPDLTRPGFLPRALRTGVAQLAAEVTPADLIASAHDEEHLRILRALDPTSLMAVPLRTRGRTVGAIVLARSGAAPGYTREDLEVGEELGRRCAIAIDNARLYREAQQEIAERTRAETALRESEERYRSLFGRVPIGLYRTTREGRIVAANQALASMLGYAAPEDLREARVADIVIGEDLQLEREQLEREGVVQHYRLRLRRRDGAIIWAEDRARAVRDHEGRVVAYEGSLEDVDERWRAEQAVRFLTDASAALVGSLDYETTVQTVAQLAVPRLADWCTVYTLRDDGDLERGAVAHADPAFAPLVESLRRYPPSPTAPGSRIGEVLRTGVSDLVPDISPDYPASIARDDEHLAILRRLDFASSMTVALRARGRILGAVAFFRTRSGQRYERRDLGLAEQLAQRAALSIDNARLYRQAQDAIRARDEFLSIASHELLTPVTGIKGTAELLLRRHARGLLSEERIVQALATIADSSQRLGRLVDDLLDVSRVRLGRLRVEPRPTDVVAIVRQVAERFGEALDERHHLVVDVPPSCTSYIAAADPTRVEQVLMNLLQNAVKYSPDGGEVRVSVRPDDRGVAVSVVDQGIGLPADAAEAIFEPFGRAANAAARQVPGMGLGLYISRDIVERHGGRLWAESPGEQRGTTVTFWLPAAADTS